MQEQDLFQLRSRLARQRAQHCWRARVSRVGKGNLVQFGNAQVLNFCSNDYLGLSTHPALESAAKKAVDDYGVGSGAAHLVSGHTRLHQQLEEQLADWVGRPKALLFSTGYMANMGVISALLERGDTVIQDKLNHASLLDGAQLSQARLLRYRHGDTAALAQRLTSAAGRKLVVTDSVFSMDGDLAPLVAMAEVTRHANGWLMVDDAHGFGVLGAGHGVLAELKLSLAQVPVYVATLGKALGTFGAFVAGDDDLIEFLLQFCRPSTYTTAPPPAVAAATLAALAVLQGEPERLQRLQRNIDYFKLGAQAYALPLMPSDTAIQPLLVGDAQLATALSSELLARGFLITAIRPPTVPMGSARLRITLNAEHSEAQIQRLLEALAELYRANADSLQHLSVHQSHAP